SPEVWSSPAATVRGGRATGMRGRAARRDAGWGMRDAWLALHRTPPHLASRIAHPVHISRSIRAPRNTTMLTIPFAVKNAALSRDRAPGRTRWCSHAVHAAPFG